MPPAVQLSTACRPVALAKLDQRTKEARLLRETVADLSAHLGGAPSATQQAMIARAAWLTLYVARLDAKAADAGGMTERDSRQYLAWSNSLTRTLRQLGMKGAPPRAPTLAETLAQSPGAHARADAAARAAAPAPSSAAAPPARAVEAVRGTSPEAVAA